MVDNSKIVDFDSLSGSSSDETFTFGFNNVGENEPTLSFIPLMLGSGIEYTASTSFIDGQQSVCVDIDLTASTYPYPYLITIDGNSHYYDVNGNDCTIVSGDCNHILTICTVDPNTISYGADTLSFQIYPSSYSYVSSLLEVNGIFYGVLSIAGPSFKGLIFTADTLGNTNPIHFFSGPEGNSPAGPLILGSDGFLYGTTQFGGSFNQGVIFKSTLDGATVTSIHDFHYDPNTLIDDGINPNGALLQASNGIFYGLTTRGGSLIWPNSAPAVQGSGILFSCDTSGNYGKVFTFDAFHLPIGGFGIGFLSVCGTLIEPNNDGFLYGVTTRGVLNGSGEPGTLFKYDINTNTMTILRILSGGTYQSLIKSKLLYASDGYLYGTDYYNGDSSLGLIAKISLDGTECEVIHNFSGITYDDGANPTSDGLIESSDGFLYGNTYDGGSYIYNSSSNQGGTIFRLDFYGNYEIITYLPNIVDTPNFFIWGYNPNQHLIQATDGNFYGTTFNDRDNNGFPTIYRLNYSSQTYCVSGTVSNCIFADVEWATENVLCFNITGTTPPFSIYIDGILEGSNIASGTTNCFYVDDCTTTHEYTIMDSALTANTLTGTTLPCPTPVFLCQPDVYWSNPGISNTLCFYFSAGTPPFKVTIDNVNYTAFTTGQTCFTLATNCTVPHTYSIIDSAPDCLVSGLRIPVFNNPSFTGTGSNNWFLDAVLQDVPGPSNSSFDGGSFILSGSVTPGQCPSPQGCIQNNRYLNYDLVNVPSPYPTSIRYEYEFSGGSISQVPSSIGGYNTLFLKSPFAIGSVIISNVTTGSTISGFSSFIPTTQYPTVFSGFGFTLFNSYYGGVDFIYEIDYLQYYINAFTYDCRCRVSGTTTICPTPSVTTTASYTASTCTNNGIIQLSIGTGGTPDYTYTLKLGPTIVSTFGPTSLTAHTFTGLSQGTYTSYITDSSVPPLTSNTNTTVINNSFYADFYNTSTTFTGSTFCYIVTGASTNIVEGFYYAEYSASTTQNPLYFTGNTNTVNCFNIPISACGSGHTFYVREYDQSISTTIIPPLFNCTGGTDVLFLLDYTNTMGPVIDDIKSSIGTIVSTIGTVSNNNYSLSLAIFDEQCRTKSVLPPYDSVYYSTLPTNQRITADTTSFSSVPCGTFLRRQYFTALEQFSLNNSSSFTNNLNILNTPSFPLGTGAGNPEPSDKAVAFSIANQLTQTNTFIGNFRPTAAKFIILITDAQPGGDDDQYTFADFNYINNTLIPQCQALGIRVILMRNCLICAGDALDNLAMQTGGSIINNYNPISIQNAFLTGCQGQIITNISQLSGCSYSEQYNVPCLSPSASTTSIQPYCSDPCYGEIEITISGGQSPYLFQLTNSSGIVLTNFFNIPTSATTSLDSFAFQTLCEGTYYPRVVDSSGYVTTATPVTLIYTFDADISILPTITGLTGTICIDISGTSISGYPIYITNNSTNIQDIYNGDLGVNCYVYSAGCYTVNVFDPLSNCEVTGTTCIPATAFTCSAITYTQPSCNYANGSITPSVNGGIGPFKFDLYRNGTLLSTKNTPLRTPTPFTGLTSGTYNFLITDTSNNLQINCFTGTVLYNSFFVNVDLLNNCSPTIDYSITVSGGTAPYNVYFDATHQYVVQSGTTGFTVPCTVSSVTISDSSTSACTYTESFSAICGPSLTYSVINIDCGTTQLGSITINGSGGNPPYEYSVDGGITFLPTNTFTGLYLGTYNLALRDQSGCTITDTATVQFTAGFSITATTIPADCSNPFGGLIVDVSGGIPPYQFSTTGPNGFFVPANTGQNQFISLTSFPPGTLHLYVRDSSCCFIEEFLIVGDRLQTTINTTPTTCNNLNGGTITVTPPTSGTPPYQYSLNGGPLSPNNTFVGLSAGTYVVTITDAITCTANFNTFVGYPFDISIASSYPDCGSNFTNGYIVATANGSVAPYEYSLDGGTFSSNNIFTNLSSDTYTIIAKDSNGCTAQTEVTLLEQNIEICVATQINNSCIYVPPDGSGVIDITVLNPAGGSGPYTYNIQSFSIFPPINQTNGTGSFTGLPTDNYVVTVTDTLTLGCSVNANVLIQSPFPPQINIISATNINCFDPNSGAILFTITDGVPIFNYTVSYFQPGIGYTQVDNGTTSYSAITTGLSQQNVVYYIEVTDAIGCYDNAEQQIFGPILVNTNITPPTCGVNNNGQITLTPTTGTPPYEYSIDGVVFGPSPTFTGLTAGTYTFIVRDDIGCTASTNTIIPGPLDISAVTTNETCLLTSAGTINAIVISGGTAPYQYSIDNVTFTNSGYFTGLTFGTYTIFAQDSVACTSDIQVTLYQPVPMILTTITTPEICNKFGLIEVGVVNGIPPYQYGVSGGTLTPSPQISLSAGTYDVIVIDSYGCTATTQATVAAAEPITVSAITTNESCLLNSGGTITISATGGTLPYEYSIDNGSTYTNNSYFSGLTIGNFDLVVRDINGCSGTSTVSIGSPVPITISAITSTVPKCDSISTTSITLLGSGGTAPYTYGWSGLSATNQTLIVDYLTSAGTYSVIGIVYDIFGCSGVTTVTFSATSTITPPIEISSNTITCICNSVNLSVSNTSGYTYSGLTWNNGKTGDTISISSCTQGISTYYVTGINEFGCVITSNTVTVIFSDLIINLFKIDATCPTCSDGYAQVQIINGIGPYIFNWTGTTNNSSTATNLIPGTYIVEVIDTISGCIEKLSFEIFGKRPIDCIYEPIRNLFGDIVLNPDGSISFYDTTVGPNKLVDCVPEECCLEFSTLQLPLQYCDCKCLWRQGCTSSGDTTVDKLILGANGMNGVQLGPSSTNDIKTCHYQASFDYMFNFDCKSLFECVDAAYSGSVLNFLNGLSASATIESLVSGNTYVTTQIVPIWSFDLANDPTGVYFGGQSSYCDLIYRSLFNQLGADCATLTDTSFAAIWSTASFKIDESLEGDTIKIGIILNGFNCDYNLFIDNIRIEEVCIITNDQIISSGSGAVGNAGGSTSVNNTNGGCPGFDLVKIVDNKKSWVYNETTYTRFWDHLKYRDTDYIDYDERLDINTKEVDININPANAINFSLYCFTQSISGCCVSTELYIPSSKYDNTFGQIGLESILMYPTNPILGGHVYDIKFSILADSKGQLQQSSQNLTIGFLDTGLTEYMLFDNINVVAPSTLSNTYNFSFTVTASTTIAQYSGFYIRITIPWVGIEEFSVVPNSISIKEYCPPPPGNLNNVLPINSATTYNQFVGLVQTELIDVKDRQTISAYPLLRYYFDTYLGLCTGYVGPTSGGGGPVPSGATSGATSGLTNNCSQQYNYGNVNSFANAISNYWLDLIEQLVPATTIWGGGSSGSVGTPGSTTLSGVIGGGGSRGNTTYSNTIFDQNKFVYRDFQIGYCDTEYCFEGPDGEPTYSAACYVAQSGPTTLTPAGFSALTLNLATTVNPQLINNKILDCSNSNLSTCCNANPSDCFASMSYGIKFEESGVIVSATTIEFTDINNLPTSNVYLDLIYGGLGTLGYSIQFPYNGLEISKISNTGCADPINLTPYLTVKYSCLTATTVVTSGNPNTIVHQPLFVDFPSNSVRVDGKIAISGDTIIYGVVRENTTPGSYGYIYYWNVLSPGFNTLRPFLITNSTLLNPCSGVVFGSDNYLYGTTVNNSLPTYNTFGGLYRIDPNDPNGTYQELYKFKPADGGGIWNGQELLSHSDGNIYIPLIMTNPAPYATIFKWDVGAQTGNILFVLPFMTSRMYLTTNKNTGEIYGTTSNGGTSGGGTIFKFDPSSALPLYGFTVIYNFNPTSGIYGPNGPLLQYGPSTFYGLTTGNGTNAASQSLFRLNSLLNTVTPVRLFNNVGDDTRPKGELATMNGKIYGITTTLGKIFEYTVATNQFTYVHNFNGGNNGTVTTSTYSPTLIYTNTQGYDWVYGTTIAGGNNNLGTIYRIGYNSTGSTNVISGAVFYECTFIGIDTGTIIAPFIKEEFNFSSSTYVQNTAITGLACTPYCPGLVVNPNVEVIVEDLSDSLFGPCVVPGLTKTCNLVYATHVDSDVWFEGTVTVTQKITPNSTGGAVLITSGPAL